jgi:hypothetical protein
MARPIDSVLCASGKYPWLDPDSRRRCCIGYVRACDTTRAGLEAIGAEHIVPDGMWRGRRGGRPAEPALGDARRGLPGRTPRPLPGR